MTTTPHKPKDFSLSRYPQHLWRYFPQTWLPKELRSVAVKQKEEIILRGESELMRCFNLTRAQFYRALRLGLPFRQKDTRKIFNKLECTAFLEENKRRINCDGKVNLNKHSDWRKFFGVPEHLLSTLELSGKIRKRKSTISQWVREKGCPVHVIEGRHFFDLNAVTAWLATQEA